MSFRPIAEVRGAVRIYAEGWQTWSPVRLLGPGDESIRAAGERDQKVMLRPGKPVPRGQVQAEGVLAMEFVGAPARAWFAPSPAREVATLRVLGDGARSLISADGDVESVEAPDLPSVLAMVGDRLRVPQLRPIPPGWCSWSFYFKGVTERDVIENVEAAARLGLPIDVFQLDDGYETVIGDWLAPSARFGSLRRTAEAVRAAGKTAGIWLPPFLVDPRSELARRHPGWLFADVDAGLHWGQTMRILDVTRPEAARTSGMSSRRSSSSASRSSSSTFSTPERSPGSTTIAKGCGSFAIRSARIRYCSSVARRCCRASACATRCASVQTSCLRRTTRSRTSTTSSG